MSSCCYSEHPCTYHSRVSQTLPSPSNISGEHDAHDYVWRPWPHVRSKVPINLQCLLIFLGALRALLNHCKTIVEIVPISKYLFPGGAMYKISGDS